MSGIRFGQRDVVVLAGCSGLGKSTLAARLFPGVHVVSSDAWRGMIADDETDQSIHGAVFAMVDAHARARIAAGRLAVIDSTALRARDRRSYVTMAADLGVRAHLVIVHGELRDAINGNRERAASGGREVPVEVVKRMWGLHEQLVIGARRGEVAREGWESVTVIDRAQAAMIEPAMIGDPVPVGVDVIADVHGCAVQLQQLLGEAGFEFTEVDGIGLVPVHPDGRVAFFVGDITDRGRNSIAALELVDRMIGAGSGRIAAIGNHDWKLYRLLVLERDVKISHGLETTVAEIQASGREKEITDLVRRMFEHAPAFTHLPISGGLVITHGALRADMLGRTASMQRRDPVSSLAMFGETDGELPDGRPHRIYDWVGSWDGRGETVVFGHDVMGLVPRRMSEHGNVWGIDCGAAFGGPLVALRFPEMTFLSVDHAEPVPYTHEALTRTAG